MSRKCLLETNGYQILLHLKRVETTEEELFDTIFEFKLNPSLGETLVRSIPTIITLKDLQSLITYFEQHITNLKEDHNSESHTFVTRSLDFQVQASSGNIFSESEGVFTIVFMVNVGKAYEGACSTYLGGETLVTVENIRSFTSSLQAALVELFYSN